MAFFEMTLFVRSALLKETDKEIVKYYLNLEKYLLSCFIGLSNLFYHDCEVSEEAFKRMKIYI